MGGQGLGEGCWEMVIGGRVLGDGDWEKGVGRRGLGEGCWEFRWGDRDWEKGRRHSERIWSWSSCRDLTTFLCSRPKDEST